MDIAQNLCVTSKLGYQPLRPLGLWGNKKSSKSDGGKLKVEEDGRGTGHTEIQRNTRSIHREMGGGSKRDRKETARVEGRRTEWMKPEEEEQRRGQG